MSTSNLLNAFLVFKKETCYLVLQNLLLAGAPKHNYAKRIFIGKGNFFINEAASCLAAAYNCILNEVFATVALSFSLVNMTKFTFCFIMEAL